jgi:phage FluMu protein Com
MKLSIKKIYCGSCHKLVKGLEKNETRFASISCPRCGTLLAKWDGLFWKRIKQGI